MKPNDQRIIELERKLKSTQMALKTLIAWMVQSANTPIRRDEAMQLIRMADGED